MTARYYVAEPIEGTQVTLAGPEAHHLLHVMRAKLGDQVTLFDGSGKEFIAQIAQSTRREATLAIQSSAVVSRESARDVTLAVALPKGERQAWMIEKLVELGVTRLVPLETERSQVKLGDSVLDRLRRGVVEASKQCERNRLMEIAPSATWEEYCARPGEAERLIAVPGATMPVTVHLADGEAKPVIAAIGPEGDWSPVEVAMAVEQGWKPVSLGPRILRVETAAILVAGLLIGAK
jgi:16S rRNA (uracil1498-N3)-methyltransferase